MTQKRHPKGSPKGGQYASQQRADESIVDDMELDDQEDWEETEEEWEAREGWLDLYEDSDGTVAYISEGQIDGEVTPGDIIYASIDGNPGGGLYQRGTVKRIYGEPGEEQVEIVFRGDYGTATSLDVELSTIAV